MLDLTPTDNAWGIIKRKLRDTRLNSRDELNATIKATWSSNTSAESQADWLHATVD